MSKLAVATVVLAGACQSNNMVLERKVDNLATQLAATQREVADLHQALDQPTTQRDIERKLDELAKRLDAVMASSTHGTQPPRRRPEPSPDKVYALAVDGHPFEGPPDAVVTLVIALDYADPYTDKTREGRAEMRKKYGNDLRIVYRNFVVHPQVATAAALASCAAAKQQKFAALDDLLWEKGFKLKQFDRDVDAKHCWETVGGCPVVLGFAKELRLDLARFKRDMTACDADIKADMADLQKFGIGATPTFFINGRYILGAQPIESFEALIDEELAKAKERITNGSTRATYYKDWVLGKGLTQLEP